MNEDKMIRVWEFYEAPKELQELSPHGGDEDWLAVLPAVYKDRCDPDWINERFGCCRISGHELPDGRQVRIGAHA